MSLSDQPSNKGVALVAEAAGTSILVCAYCLNLQYDDDAVYAAAPLAMSAIYFVLLMMLLPLSGAEMNPAITFSILISARQYRKHWQFAVMTICSQMIGGLLGM